MNDLNTVHGKENLYLYVCNLKYMEQNHLFGNLGDLNLIRNIAELGVCGRSWHRTKQNMYERIWEWLLLHFFLPTLESWRHAQCCSPVFVICQYPLCLFQSNLDEDHHVYLLTVSHKKTTTLKHENFAVKRVVCLSEFLI